MPKFLPDDAPLTRDLCEKTIVITAMVTYPGSRCSDLLVGGHKITVPNAALRKASREFMTTTNSELADGNILLLMDPS